MRAGPWKLYLPLDAKYVSLGRKTAAAGVELYDVVRDVGEVKEVSAEHLDVVKRLTAFADRIRVEIGDVNKPGRGQRTAGRVEHPGPILKAP